MQHVDRDAKGVEIKTDVDVITDADCITMDDGDLRSGVKKMIDDRIGEVIDGAPEELDTLKEIATELEKNQSGVSTIIKNLKSKIDKTQITDKYIFRDSNTVPSSMALVNMLTALNKDIDKKVSKIDGKGLSTNDFTDVLKNKLDNIEDGAQKNKVTSVNGMTGDVVVEAGSGSVDLSGYAKTSDVDEKLKGKLDSSEYASLKSLVDDIGNATISEIDEVKAEVNKKADKTEVKTKLSEMTDDETHRTVTDEEKKEWSDQRSHTDNMISTMRSYVDTRLMSKVERKDILNFKNCIVLSSDAYSKLSDAEKAKSDTLYFTL